MDQKSELPIVYSSWQFTANQKRQIETVIGEARFELNIDLKRPHATLKDGIAIVWLNKRTVVSPAILEPQHTDSLSDVFMERLYAINHSIC